MAALGTLVILTAFVLAAAAFAASVAGARRRDTRLIRAGTGLFHTVTALTLVVSAIIIHAFVIGDYSIKYVQRYSDAVQPLFYKLTSYWGGLDGSLLFWVALLAAFGSVAVAEGIESMADLQALMAMGCDFGQGVLVAPPMPKERFLELLRQRNNKPRAQAEQAPATPQAVAAAGRVA